MSLPRDIARHRLLWTWHRRIGIVAALLVLLLSLTGLALNHTDRLGLDERYVSWEWLLDWYGIQAPAEVVSFVAGETRVSQLGDRLFAGQRMLPGHFGTLRGAVPADGFLIAALSNALLVVTADGQLVEQIGSESGVPAAIEAIGLSDNDRIVVRTDSRTYAAGPDALEWRPEEITTTQVRWAHPAPADEALLSQLRRDFRARVLPVERLFLDLHSGRIAGFAGTLLMDLAAVLLLILALTGSWLWLMRRG